MKPLALAADTFRATIRRGTVLVWWWTPRLAPCRAFEPIYAAATARHRHIVFSAVNVDDEPDLAAAARIHALPGLMAFRDGALVFSRTGFLVAESLDAVVHDLERRPLGW